MFNENNIKGNNNLYIRKLSMILYIEVMRVFGKIIYYDKGTINDYKAIINGRRNVSVEEYAVTNDKGANGGLSFLKADVKATKSYKGKIQESDLYDCDEFEKMLDGRDDYVDFTLSADCDIATVPNKSIIKVDGFIEIPEEFDVVKLIDLFKPMLMKSDSLHNVDEMGRTALCSILNDAHASKIPLVFECEGELFCSKIQQKHLLIDYEELSEIDTEVTILARIISSCVNKSKPYYDPLKDFISLNRMMRKAIGERQKEMSPMYVDTNYRNIEILAIYK